MKIKSIAAICKAEKTIITASGYSCQWIGNGKAFYPLYNLPPLSKDHIYTMFDVPDDKRDKFYFDNPPLPENISFENTASYECILARGSLSFSESGRTLLPLKTSLGLVFVNERLLTPFADAADGYDLYERIDSTGKVYIAVKEGFILIGIIFPYDIITDEFINSLRSLLTLAEISQENNSPARNAVQSNYEQEEILNV